jgi:hypothetical protein
MPWQFSKMWWIPVWPGACFFKCTFVLPSNFDLPFTLPVWTGLPDLSWYNKPKWENNTKMATKIPNDHKIYPNGNKIPNGYEIHQISPISMPSKGYRLAFLVWKYKFHLATMRLNVSMSMGQSKNVFQVHRKIFSVIFDDLRTYIHRLWNNVCVLTCVTCTYIGTHVVAMIATNIRKKRGLVYLRVIRALNWLAVILRQYCFSATLVVFLQLMLV